MRIPTDPVEREMFYLDIMNKCMVSVENRRTEYDSLRSYYLFGSGPEEAPALYNKIYPHIDQLSAFMYAADSTRFSINIGASQPAAFHKMVPSLTKGLYDYWLNRTQIRFLAKHLTGHFATTAPLSNQYGVKAYTRTWLSLLP